MKHVWDCPNEWIQLEEEGHLDNLPVHYAGDPEPDSPAYFINARPPLLDFWFSCSSCTRGKCCEVWFLWVPVVPVAYWL